MGFPSFFYIITQARRNYPTPSKARCIIVLGILSPHVLPAPRLRCPRVSLKGIRRCLHNSHGLTRAKKLPSIRHFRPFWVPGRDLIPYGSFLSQWNELVSNATHSIRSKARGKIPYTTSAPRYQQYETLKVPRSVHILGTGSVSKFIAHSLQATPNPSPITLLLHKPGLIKDWTDANSSITLVRNNGSNDVQTGFKIELVSPAKDRQLRGAERLRERYGRYISNQPIHNLIVSVKAYQTVSALAAVKDRLGPDSTILFLQNGMGIMEDVIEKLFPDFVTRPNFMLGVISHGVNSTGPFSFNHASHGTVSIGLLPRVPFKDQKGPQDIYPWSTASRYLLRTVTRVPILAAVGLSPTELLQTQLEKLAVNCVVNPLTVMLDNRNSSILSGFALKRVIRLLLAEISLVIRSLPELKGIPNVDARFSPERLESFVRNVATSTAENVSSMLQDTRRGSRTEVEYLNGYIVKRGEELGIKPVLNYMLMQMVMGKQNMISQEVDNYLPYQNKIR